MHFNSNTIAFILLVWSILLVSCNKDYEGTSNIGNSINTVEELNQLIGGINFQGTLSNGMTINFTPNQLFTNMEGNSFTDLEGLNFTHPITTLSGEFGKGSASLEFGADNFKFPVLFCTTVKELRFRYPELQFSPSILNYAIFIAAGNSRYSERDILYGSPYKVDNMITVLAGRSNPTGPSHAEGNFITSKGIIYEMNGDYKKEDNLIVSFGYLNEIFGSYQNERYTLYMNCDN